jgi:hypothetical protein
MGQEHRPERRMGSYTATSQQFGSEYLGNYPDPTVAATWHDLPPENPHSFEYARPKKPKPTRPSSAARAE